MKIGDRIRVTGVPHPLPRVPYSALEGRLGTVVDTTTDKGVRLWLVRVDRKAGDENLGLGGSMFRTWWFTADRLAGEFKRPGPKPRNRCRCEEYLTMFSKGGVVSCPGCGQQWRFENSVWFKVN